MLRKTPASPPLCPVPNLHAGYAPRWVYLFAAFAVVFYTWLDCFDGKQARRTGTSSPLGQLFDHGCDALSVNLLLASIGASLGVPCGWAHGIGMFGVSGSRGSRGSIWECLVAGHMQWGCWG